MPYAKASIPNLRKGETGFQLDGKTGPQVAASMSIVHIPEKSSLSFSCTVRVVPKVAATTAKSVAASAADSNELRAQFTQLVPLAECETPEKLQACAKKILEITLGEKVEGAQIPDNIRAIISASAIATMSYNLADLTITSEAKS